MSLKGSLSYVLRDVELSEMLGDFIMEAPLGLVIIFGWKVA